MVGQPLQINHLNATRLQQCQNLGLGAAGVTVQQGDRCCKRSVIQRLLHQSPVAAIAALDHFSAPANLFQNGGERSRPLPAAPAVNQRFPVFGVIHQMVFDMLCRVAGDQCCANLAGLERIVLNINRAHPRAFVVIQNRQVYRTGDVVLSIFRRRTHVDNGIEWQGG